MSVPCPFSGNSKSADIFIHTPLPVIPAVQGIDITFMQMVCCNKALISCSMIEIHYMGGIHPSACADFRSVGVWVVSIFHVCCSPFHCSFENVRPDHQGILHGANVCISGIQYSNSARKSINCPAITVLNGIPPIFLSHFLDNLISESYDAENANDYDPVYTINCQNTSSRRFVLPREGRLGNDRHGIV